MIDWINFTPWQSLIGGMMIGLAAVVLLLTNGRVFGISGILDHIVFEKNRSLWQLAILAGIFISPLIYQFLGGEILPIKERSTIIVIIAGLLVGLGSALGSGCTSGHGVCGISRFSIRSIVATGCFMLSGFITLFIFRHLLTTII